MQHRQHRNIREKGFTLIMVAFCVFLLFGLLGLAFDLGRMYIHKSESMTYVDAAAVAAARELDGTEAGGTRARNAALQSWARWNFSSTDFSNPVVEFSTSRNGPWEANPISWIAVGHARVTATVNNIQLAFLPVVGTATTGAVAHLAVAGQVPSKPIAVFPFSPIAHADVDSPAESILPENQNFGFIRGGKYTFRWPNDPNHPSAQYCPDDDNPLWRAKVDADTAAFRGIITTQSTSEAGALIQSDLVGDHQVIPTLGDAVNTYGSSGNHGGLNNDMQDRVGQDTDHETQEYFYAGTKPTEFVNGIQIQGAGLPWVVQNSDSYLWRQHNSHSPWGNNRRIVTVLVNAGYASSTGTAWGGSAYTALGYAQFFLYELTYQGSQNQSYCAEYIGNNACQGCRGATAVPGDGSNVFIIRLEQ